MRIAVNALFFSGQHGGFEVYLFELLIEMAKQFPEQEFVFVSDRPIEFELSDFKNIVFLVAGPGIKRSITRFWWNRFTLPKVLARYKPDVLIEHSEYCSNTHNSGRILFYNHNNRPLPSGKIASAKYVIVFSMFEKQAFLSLYPNEAAKLYLVNITANKSYHPITWEQKEHFKQTYASGYEYLLVHAGERLPKQILLNILKAFSLFKVRQRTGMKLVVYGTAGSQITEELKTYKFREGVRLVSNFSAQHHSELMTGAYALLYPDGFILPVVQAFMCKVAVIAPVAPGLQELTGENSLPCNFADPQDIAEQMKTIYKDEELRSKLINEGYRMASQFSTAAEARKLRSFISTQVST